MRARDRDRRPDVEALLEEGLEGFAHDRAERIERYDLGRVEPLRWLEAGSTQCTTVELRSTAGGTVWHVKRVDIRGFVLLRLGTRRAFSDRMKAVALRRVWVGASLLLLGASVAVGCSGDDDDVGEPSGGGAAGSNADSPGGGGAAGSNTDSPGGGGSKIDGGAGAGGDMARAGGLGGGAGGAPTCDCGDNVEDAKVPLECVCEGGVCEPSFDEVREKYQGGKFGTPYYVLLGTCADGYRSLSYEEALENAGRTVFDSDGRMVFDRFSGYGDSVPEACGFEGSGLGSVTIGEDPSHDCTYCLLDGDDAGSSGAGGSGGEGGEPHYPESKTPRCELD